MKNDPKNYSDIFIIGGGINGVAIAADASGRGLRVTLAEKNDLAGATSSASSKLIHGGLRYLEQREFCLVREALKEQKILLRKAPHLIHPLEFILPLDQSLRPTWLLRLGFFFYDHLVSRRQIPGSKMLNLERDLPENPLQKKYKRGFSYYDCQTDDARLVITTARAAKENGANILTRSEVIAAKKEDALWRVTTKDFFTGETHLHYTKVLLNAAGPWVETFNQKILNIKTERQIQLIKGSHIVVPKIKTANRAFILQNRDGRVVFVIPFHSVFTLIGTTDVLFSEDPSAATCTESEKNYLVETVNQYFRKTISTSEIIWAFAGVRTVTSDGKKDPAKISRDSHLELNTEKGLPILSIYGGKLTSHRHLAERALKILKPFFPTMGSPWTATTPLPGGALAQESFSEFSARFQNDFPWLPEPLATRYAQSYGTLAYEMLTGTKSLADLGIEFGAGLYQKEVEYLIQNEWAKTAADILWRRTKLGLFFSPTEINNLESWLGRAFSCHPGI